MTNNSRKGMLNFLNGLLKGNRSINELIIKEKIFFITYTNEPESFYKVGYASERSKSNDEFDREREQNTYSKEQVVELESSPKNKVQVIKITYENETKREEGDSTFPSRDIEEREEPE